MKAGQTLSWKGYQVALFPANNFGITQISSSNSISHCCGNAMDISISGVKNFPIYAPFDCYCYASQTNEFGNTRYFQSEKKVWVPMSDGKAHLTYVSFCAIHGNQVGGTRGSDGYFHWKQGQQCYTSGEIGIAAGDHSHLEASFQKHAQLIAYGYYCSFGNYCYALAGGVPLNQVFWMNGTTYSNPFGMKFYVFNESGMQEGSTPSTGGNGANSNPNLKWIIPVVKGAEYTRSDWLTWEQSLNNARCFYGEMHARGWSLNAICGILGNAYLESQVNPNCWQDNYIGSNTINYEGFGLVQWTPYTNCTDWLKEKGYWGKFAQYGTAECNLLDWEFSDSVPHEREQWYPTTGYNLSKEEFKKSTADVTYLTRAFHYNYERGGYSSGAQREAKAIEFYNYLKGLKPELPDGAILDGDYSPLEPEVPASGKKKKWLYWLKPWWKK